jgi:hypothetical protein
MRPRKHLSFLESGLLAILALPAVGCGGRIDAESTTPNTDGGLQDPSCNWSRVWSDPAAPNDCTWHYEFDGDPVRCAGFPMGSGTPDQCRTGCGHDMEGDPADTCGVTGLGDSSGYMLTCSATAGRCAG